MTLARLIADLKQTTKGKELSKKERKELSQEIQNRIIFPKDFEDGEVELDNINSCNKKSPSYDLLISAFPERSLENVQPVLDKTFERAKKMPKLKRGIANLRYDVYWSLNDFLEEQNLRGLFFDKITVEARAYSCDTTKTRRRLNDNDHKINTTLKAGMLTFGAIGNYGKYLNHLVSLINPQYAKLTLSQDSAERLLRPHKPRLVKDLLERTLKPKTRQEISLNFNSGAFVPGISNKSSIEINVRTDQLEKIVDTIGIPLVNPPSHQESRVNYFIKKYGLFDSIDGRKKQLNDMKKIAREIPKMDLKLIFNHPMITIDSAKELFDAEINGIYNSYRTYFIPDGFGNEVHRSNAAREFPRIHFGKELVDSIDKFSYKDFLTKLKKKGYLPKTKELFYWETDKSYNDFREHEKSLKEIHLLRFFMQSYPQNPEPSINKYRDFYKNTPPKLEIYSDEVDRPFRRDASSLPNIVLPSKAKLLSFTITEHEKDKTPYSDDLAITRSFPLSERIHFWSRTSFDSPRLLQLQEYACREMGINFK